MNRVEYALNLRAMGYNCSQAVAYAFKDIVDIDEKTLFKVSEGFGTGMGSLESVCGAISGGTIILGLLNSTANLESPDSKAKTLALSKELVTKFKEKNGTIICKELKGVQTSRPLRSCPDCIKDAIELLESIINK